MPGDGGWTAKLVRHMYGVLYRIFTESSISLIYRNFRYDIRYDIQHHEKKEEGPAGCFVSTRAPLTKLNGFAR